MSPYSHPVLTMISDLGDSAVMVPVALVVAAELLWTGQRRTAWILIAAAAVAAGDIGLIKIAFIGCGMRLMSMEIVSPSGHAALSAAILLSLSAIVNHSLRGALRYVPPVIALILIVSIAATRVVLGMHTVDEVVIGGGFGTIVGAAAYTMINRSRQPIIKVAIVLIGIVLTAALMDGVRLPAEEFTRYV